MSKTGPVKAALLTALMFAAPACESDDNPTTPTPPPAVIVNETFNGSVSPGGSTFYSFTSGAFGLISLTLQSVTVQGEPVGDQLVIGLGNPVGTGCNIQSSAVASAGTAPQLEGSANAGVYCARVADTGALTETVEFSLLIGRPQ